MFEGKNIVVLDLETLHSADDCRHCDQPESWHHIVPQTMGLPLSGIKPTPCQMFVKIGWDNKVALGLSIGCYYSYVDGIVHWFDAANLEETMRILVECQPLMVSFNGIGFDFVLMRALLRQEVDNPASHPTMLGPDWVLWQERTMALCDRFKVLAAQSYDILAEVWRVDPHGMYVKGLNSLDAILKANGLPGKTGDGAQAPRDWQAGLHAKVMSYCQNDVLQTKALFELLVTQNGVMQRANGPIQIGLPRFSQEERDA